MILLVPQRLSQFVLRSVRRLLPSSIAGRIALILTLCLFSAQVIAFWIYLGDRLETSRRIFALSFADRAVTIAELLDTIPAAEQTKFLEVVNSPFLQVDIVDRQPSRSRRGSGHHRELQAVVRSYLQALNRPVEVQVLNPWHRHSRAHPASTPLMPSRQHLMIAVKQPDGRWLVFVAPLDIAPLRRGRHLLVWLISMGIAIWLFSLWAANRVTQPITQFARAAEQFGQDVNAPPLPETGSRELRQAIQAFNQMQERLRQLVNDRTFMLAAISHDLRTVLTRLKLRTEFIADPEQAQKANTDIDQMQAMLQETLTFARAETASEADVKVDLAGLLQSLCDDLTDAGHQASYEGPMHLTYECQPVALRRAFMNLMENAVKYGEVAIIRLTLKPEWIVITICDQGPGIPPEMQEQVFTPFFRLEQSRNRETGGAGLGLTVARTAIRRHGGDITFDSIEGGLQVRVVLPRSPRQQL